MNQIEQSRAEKMGRLIRRARIKRGRSRAKCGQALAIDSESYDLIEAGDAPVSLPELEVLALFLNVSMSYFWGSEELTEDDRVDYSGYLTLRQAIIGTTLRQFRNDKGMTRDELVEAADLEQEKINAYESGENIPYFELEKILNVLHRSINDLADDSNSTLVQHEENLKIARGFEELPSNIKRFVSASSNQGYLETAMRLSNLEAEELRKIAEGIMEITY